MSEPVQPWPLVQQGSQGVQVDGISGPETRTAVRGFQQAVRLAVDGIVGP